MAQRIRKGIYGGSLALTVVLYTGDEYMVPVHKDDIVTGDIARALGIDPYRVTLVRDLETSKHPYALVVDLTDLPETAATAEQVACKALGEIPIRLVRFTKKSTPRGAR